VPLLFSYGTLQTAEVQQSTFGRVVRTDYDRLPRFAPATAGPHANAVFTGDPADGVPGMALDLTDAELSRADEYERPFDYRRISVTLASGREAWVYVFSPL